MNRLKALMQQEGFVLAAVQGRFVVQNFAYYDGEGTWTTEENAQVYYTRKAMHQGLKEAHKGGRQNISVTPAWTELVCVRDLAKAAQG